MPGKQAGFSVAEMRRRRAAFAQQMDRAEISHALVYGANRSGSAVSWLAGWPVTREALLIVAPEEDDDVLLVGYFNHVPQARRLCATRVEWAGERAVATALDLLAARGTLPGRIGVAGALPFDQYLILAEQIPAVANLRNQRRAAGDFTLDAGMTLVVQPNVVTRDGKAGVQIGELLLVTEQGPERLHAFPQGLRQAG